MVNTRGIPTAVVLAALYNHSRPQGMGMFDARPGDMTTEQATEMLKRSRTRYFDYVMGRVLKVDLKDPNGFDPYLYDRDLGAGAAQKALDHELDVLTRP